MAETRDFMLETEREMIFVNEVDPPRDFMLDGMVFLNSTSETVAPGGGRIMSSLAGHGGLAGPGGIAGRGGGLAG